MITKQVTLSTGITVTVAPVPQKIYDVIRMRHPDPPVPVLESDATATGEPMRYENRKDPDYRQALRDAEQARRKAWAEAMLLFGLPEVKVPRWYECPKCQFIAKSKEDIEEGGRVVTTVDSLLFYCPRCLEDCEVAQEDVPVLKRCIWEPPVTELAYLAPEWKPREGDQGRKLDWIEWELLRTPGDHGKVVDAINELAGVPEEAVDAVEATFRGDVEVQAQKAGAD